MRHLLSVKLHLPILLFTITTSALNAASVVTQTYSGSFPATISGTLPNQGTALEETLTLPSAGDFTAFTTSYATGGFEPTLDLFNSSGMMVATSGIPGTSPVAQPDSSISPAAALDAYLTASNLSSGTYTLTLTDWQLNQSLTATSLSDGFTQNYGDGTTFVDAAGNTRSGAYAITADLAAPSTATPEPATFLYVAPLIAMLSLFFRREARSRTAS